MNLKIAFVGLVSLFFVLPGWSQTADVKLGATGVYGEIKEGLYTNSAFKFQIQFPLDWIVLENQEAKELIKAGIKVAELDEKELERKEKYRLSLLSMLKKPAGSVDNATATLSAMKQPSSSVSPLAVANLSRKGLSESPAIRFDNDTRLINLGEKQFATFDYTMTVGERSVKGKYLVTMSGNYSITLFLSNENPADDKVLLTIVNSIRFY